MKTLLELQNLALELYLLVQKAANVVLDVYHSNNFCVECKADDSPLTQADRASHQIITEYLAENTPYPVLSEEGYPVSYQERKHWNSFWLIDPLDGTKEFLAHSDEFTINIALIQQGRPSFGIIYAPALDICYWGQKGNGAFKKQGDQEAKPIHVRNNLNLADRVAVVSRSHVCEEDFTLLQENYIQKIVTVGSSLKFCLIAEGSADFYCRHNPTMEWDTAAGQAILEASGGRMLTTSGGPFLYNKASLRNEGFLCKGY